MQRLLGFSVLVLCGCLGPELELEETSEDHGHEFVAQGDALRSRLRRDEDGWLKLPVIEAPTRFDRVGLRVDTTADLQVSARTSQDGGRTFGSWVEGTIAFAEESARNAFVDLDGGTHVEVRLKTDAVHLDFAAVELFLKTPIEPEWTGESSGGLEGASEVVSRSAWGARARSCGTTHRPNRLTIHHTETPIPDRLSVAARLRQIQAYHIDVRGWCDIGYHFLIGQDGRVYQGRPENRIGSHAGGANTDNVGISFVGDFERQAPNDEMMSAAASIMRRLSQTYSISLDRSRVKGHREVGTTQTACPGQALFGKLSSLIAKAKNGDQSPRFSDVPRTHFAYAAIERLATEGVVSGCNAQSFCPNDQLTRAQIAVLFARLEQDPIDLSADPNFSDVPSSHWAFNEIQEMSQRGITSGCGNGEFCPNKEVTRAQAAVMVGRSREIRPVTTQQTFEDVPSTHSAHGAIEALVALGMISGCSESPRQFCPDRAVTRAEAAALLDRAYHP